MARSLPPTGRRERQEPVQRVRRSTPPWPARRLQGALHVTAPQVTMSDDGARRLSESSHHASVPPLPEPAECPPKRTLYLSRATPRSAENQLAERLMGST